jgi:hypothetical protein
MKHLQSSRRRRLVRGGLASGVVALVGLASASTAGASVTIGQLAPGTSPPALCSGMVYDLAQPTVTSGNTYVVPAGGVAITSWSTNAAAGDGQQLKMKIFRKVAEPRTYRVVGHDGARALTPGTVNKFAVNIPVRPGDVLGLNDATAGAAPNACIFSAPGDFSPQRPGDLADGQSGAIGGIYGSVDRRPNITAVVGFKPKNTFNFGKLNRNEDRGTATLAVKVPGPGKLALTGKGVKTQRTGRAATAIASKTVSSAGRVKLRIKPKGQKKRKLNDAGEVKVRAKVTFTPNGTATGDVVGDPKTQSKRVKLVKND